MVKIICLKSTNGISIENVFKPPTMKNKFFISVKRSVKCIY